MFAWRSGGLHRRADHPDRRSLRGDRLQRRDIRSPGRRRGRRDPGGRGRGREPHPLRADSTILAGDTYKAFDLAPKVWHGVVNINSPTLNEEIRAPIGGVRDSGWGRTGPDSVADFTTSSGSTPPGASATCPSETAGAQERGDASAA